MKIFVKTISIFFCIIFFGILYLYFTSPIRPVAWEPSPNPGFNGSFEINSTLSKIEKLDIAGIGPEDIAKGPDSFLYAGLRDGTIIRFNEFGHYEHFVNTEGQPLGLEFDEEGNLIVADADKGLLSINQQGQILVLTDSVNGKKMKFVDDLDIASDGTIWFSDATTRYFYNDSIYSFLENRGTGRLLSYSPATNATTIHLDNLHFANGVALGPDDQYVLINETANSNIRRLWLKGEKKGEDELFYVGLPGAPDNISYNEAGIFWVAFAGIRIPEIDALANHTLIRRVIGGLPKDIFTPKSKHAFIVGLDLDGNVVYNFHDTNSDIQTLTSVNQWKNKLYIGNLASNFVAIYDLFK